MTDTLTAAGLTIKTLAERIAEIKAEIRANISANLYLESNSPAGQFLEITAEKIQQLAELLQEVHTAMDPSQATGNTLAATSSLTGTHKQLATNGTVTLTVNLDGGTTLPAGSIAAVATDSTNTWVTNADVVAPAGPAAPYSATATAGEAGVYQALAGTITTIVTAVAGWNSVTNASDADEGEEQETDPDLRVRRETEVAQGGSTAADSVQANLSGVAGVESVVVYENEMDYAQLGRPPHCIEAVVWDGSPAAAANADLAESIFENKAGGIRAFGTTSVQHIDSQGETHTIGLSRATLINILADVTVVAGTGYSGDAAVEDVISDYITDTLAVNDDVRLGDIAAIIKPYLGTGGYVTLPGGVLLAIKPAGPAAADVVIGEAEKAWVDNAAVDIVVTS